MMALVLVLLTTSTLQCLQMNRFLGVSRMGVRFILAIYLATTKKNITRMAIQMAEVMSPVKRIVFRGFW